MPERLKSDIETKEIRKLRKAWLLANTAATELAKGSPVLQAILQKLSEKISSATLKEDEGEELFFSTTSQQVEFDEELYCHNFNPSDGTVAWQVLDRNTSTYTSMAICYGEKTDENFIEFVQFTLRDSKRSLGEIKSEFEGELIDTNLETTNDKNFCIDREGNIFSQGIGSNFHQEQLGVNEGLARFTPNPITNTALN